MTSLSRGVDVPRYISSRSANSLISFSRPTRIQAVTLHYLNKILDELLLHILTSAKSLATDRIKTDGILKVLGGQSGSGSGAGALLGKNAVLEAELELRNYLDGQRKEGGKMPLGLMATSRWDGTDTFPVQKAYEALRIRCQYYSTLGDLEDPSSHSPQDQNIMSADGRPIATITPGVAIYVTALLEFVAEYILQNVGRVIERDNSDEAGLSDLQKAMEEDEGTSFWWVKMRCREEIRAREQEETGGRTRVKKPWKVPDANEWDEAAGKKKFQRQSLSMNPIANSSPSSARPGTADIFQSDRREPAGTRSLSGHDSRDSSTLASHRMASPLPTTASHQTDVTTPSTHGGAETPQLTRRVSSDKGWFGKRRGSFRASSDLGTGSSGLVIPTRNVSVAGVDTSKGDDGGADGPDDFDSLMMSGETMRMSLTPNRLRSMEGSKLKDELGDEERRSGRRRPGTLSPLHFRDGEAGNTRSAQPSPSINLSSRRSSQQERDDNDNPNSPPRGNTRPGGVAGARLAKSTSKGAPPSAYRSVDTARGTPDPTTPDDLSSFVEEEEVSPRQKRKDFAELTGSRGSIGEHKMRPRDETDRKTSIRDMVDMFNSTPPMSTTEGSFPHGSSSRESRASLSQMTSATSNDSITVGSSGRKSAFTSAGGKVRNLFGKKSGSNNSSTAGGSFRGDSQDSPATKTPSFGRRSDVDRNESYQSLRSNAESSAYPRSPSESSSTARGPPIAGLALTGAGAAVPVHPLTNGRVEGHRGSQWHNAQSESGHVVGDQEEKMMGASRIVSVENAAPADGSNVPLLSSSSLAEHRRTPSSSYTTSRDGTEGTLSTSPIHATHVQVASTSGGVTGIYQEPRANGSASELSSNTHHAGRNEPPSRKIPWSYSRQSSTAGRRLSGTAGPLGAPRVSSGSSVGHGSATGDNAPPSAWSHSRDGFLDAGNGNGARTPTVSGQSTFVTASPRSPMFSSNRPSDTARVLANLNQKMKGANSADECRFLLTQALAAAAAAVRQDAEPESAGMVRASSAMSTSAPYHSEHMGTADEELGRDSNRTASLAPPLPIEKDVKTETKEGARNQHQHQQERTEAVREQLGGKVNLRNFMLPMAVGYDVNADLSTPSHKMQGQLVSWLLDGEAANESSLEQILKSNDDLAPSVPFKSQVAPVTEGPPPEEIDTYDSAEDRIADSPRREEGEAKAANVVSRRPSNGESVRSIYRDASENGDKL